MKLVVDANETLLGVFEDIDRHVLEDRTVSSPELG